MERYYNKAGRTTEQTRTDIAYVVPSKVKTDKYGRMVHGYERNRNWTEKLLAIPRKITDVLVGPHKCGEDKSTYSHSPAGDINNIDKKFQNCLMKYREKRKPIGGIAMYGSIGLALYGIYWLGTKTK